MNVFRPVFSVVLSDSNEKSTWVSVHVSMVALNYWKGHDWKLAVLRLLLGSELRAIGTN